MVLAGPDQPAGEEAEADEGSLRAAGLGPVVPPALPDRFGDYRIEDEIGRGGMGIIYRAHQLSLNRAVALKMILATPLNSADFARRLRIEAEAAARLDHPHIVPIYEVGEHQGQPFYTMRLIEGTNLARTLRSGPFEARAAATLLATVADAVHHAHERGVLHRDLKPSNIVLDRNGAPHVTDFGLAKFAHGDGSLTLSETGLGTPNYMAPEQAAGGTKTVTVAADIYSLGVILYELLTGRPLFQAESPLEAIRCVIEREPERPSHLNPRVPRDLETICLKCLQKEPGRRYASAAALAEDLDHWLAARPIRARPVGSVEQLCLWCRRKPAQASLAGLLTLALAAGLTGVWWQSGRARTSALRETQERARAGQADFRLEAQKAQALFEATNARAGLAVLAALLRQQPTNRVVADRILAELTHRNWPLPAIEPIQHPETVRYAEFSPDGRRLATVAFDNVARLWDASTGRAIGRPLEQNRQAVTNRVDFSYRQVCMAVHFSHDGTKVAANLASENTRVWNGETGEPFTPPLSHPEWVTGARFSPDDNLLITACWNGSIRYWDVTTGNLKTAISSQAQQASFLEVSPDGRRLLSGSVGNAFVWSFPEGSLVGKILDHPGDVSSGGFSPDGRQVVTASQDGTTRIWNTETGEPLSQFLRHGMGVGVARFSPDGAWLATASSDPVVRLWDGWTGEAVAPPLTNSSRLRWIEFSPDGQRLVGAGDDGTVRLWDVRAARPHLEAIRHTGAVWSARFSPDGQRLVTASADRTCAVWDVRPGTAYVEELPGSRLARGVRWSPDGRWLVTRGAQPRLYSRSNVWSFAAWLWSDRPCVVAEFSPDGRWVVTGATDGTARVWSVERGEVAFRVRHGGAVSNACFSPDSRWLLTGARDGLAMVWDANSGERRLTLEHPAPLRPAPLRVAAFGPDAKRILTVAQDEQVRIWGGPFGLSANRRDSGPGGARLPPSQVPSATNRLGNSLAAPKLTVPPAQADPQRNESARLLVRWRPHEAGVSHARFSPDGAVVATASADSNARLWDAETGRPLSDSLAHRGELFAVEFSPDGRHVLTGSKDKTAVVWSVPDGRKEVVLQHEATVFAARFSPDGRRIVTGSEDGTARLWDTATGYPVASPLEHGDPVEDVAFSPDGAWLAVAGGRAVRIWAVPRCATSVPDWLGPLAEAVAGLRQETTWSSEPVPPAAFLALQRRLSASPPTSEVEAWGAWFCADRSQRNPTPSPTPTLAELLAREEATAQWGLPSSASVISWLLPLHPTKGWLFAQAGCLALEQYKRQGDLRDLRAAEWFADRAVALAPDQAVTWYHRASARYQADDRPGTYENVTRAERLPGATTRLSLARGQWLEEAGQIEEALSSLVRATEREGHGRPLDPPEWRDAWLRRARLHAKRGETEAARQARQQAYGFAPSPRDPAAPPSLIDLTDFYTGGFDTDWRASGFPRHNLSALPKGRQVLEGVEYDLRGLVQLASLPLEARELALPRAVEGIPIGQRCARLHFLHAADCVAETGLPLATYTLRRGTGMEEAIPISYGTEVLAWDTPTVPAALEGRVAWRGTSPAGEPVMLFRTSWTNAHPEVTVESVTLMSALAGCAPFVVAITAE